jgi:hypothetical protein
MYLHDRGSARPPRIALRGRPESAAARTKPNVRPTAASAQAVAKKPAAENIVPLAYTASPRCRRPDLCCRPVMVASGATLTRASPEAGRMLDSWLSALLECREPARRHRRVRRIACSSCVANAQLRGRAATRKAHRVSHSRPDRDDRCAHAGCLDELPFGP